jgi:tyrosine-protein kinase Etk/Wzc
MLNQIETLQIAQAGTIGDIVIVDRAIPASRPVSPRPVIELSLALLVGLFGGVSGAFLRRSLRHGVDDPEALSDYFSLPVHAVLLHSREEDRLSRARKAGTISGLDSLLVARGKDVTAEGLRSLRTALQLALPPGGRRVLSIGSLSPSEGKSFISSNLAYLFAQSGQRTLLVDADLRRGHIHRMLGLERGIGLSEVLRQAVTLDKAIIHTGDAALDVLPTGTLPSDAANLLMKADLDSFLEECSKRYGLVVVDLPPVLAVSDALIIGRYSTLNLLILKHREHGHKQIRFALRRFAQHGAAVSGLVINDISSAAQRYAYREYGYQYEYSYK